MSFMISTLPFHECILELMGTACIETFKILAACEVFNGVLYVLLLNFLVNPWWDRIENADIILTDCQDDISSSFDDSDLSSNGGGGGDGDGDGDVYLPFTPPRRPPLRSVDLDEIPPLEVIDDSQDEEDFQNRALLDRHIFEHGVMRYANLFPSVAPLSSRLFLFRTVLRKAKSCGLISATDLSYIFTYCFSCPNQTKFDFLFHALEQFSPVQSLNERQLHMLFRNLMSRRDYNALTLFAMHVPIDVVLEAVYDANYYRNYSLQYKKKSINSIHVHLTCVFDKTTNYLDRIIMTSYSATDDGGFHFEPYLDKWIFGSAAILPKFRQFESVYDNMGGDVKVLNHFFKVLITESIEDHKRKVRIFCPVSIRDCLFDYFVDRVDFSRDFFSTLGPHIPILFYENDINELLFYNHLRKKMDVFNERNMGPREKIIDAALHEYFGLLYGFMEVEKGRQTTLLSLAHQKLRTQLPLQNNGRKCYYFLPEDAYNVLNDTSDLLYFCKEKVL